MKRSFLVALTALLTMGLILGACGSSPSSRQSEVWVEFRDYARQKNWNRMENVLRNNRNRITDTDRSMCLYVVSEYLRGEDTIRGFELLKNYNINPTAQALFNAFYDSQPDTVIDYLLARGVQDKGVSTLEQALKYRRLKYVPRLLAMVDNTNLDSRTTRANWTGSAADWKTEYSWTALIYAVQAEHFDTVRSLVELGANVNLRAEDGTTAASLAYDNGLINIYNYLKEHGAVDFEPRQTAQQPAAPAPQTVYVQPSAPAQSPTPAPAPAPSTPTFQTGTYGWSNSGQNVSMQFSAGIVTMHLNNRQIWYGTYRINGTQLVISVTNTISDYSRLLGVTYSYTITSNTSFSGSGETWVRTGY
jgi:hypothetical protein